MIEGIGVVVPAHNEEALLSACLAAIEDAASQVAIACQVVVVLDDCSDGTAAVLTHFSRVARVDIQERNVGMARAEGFRVVIRRLGLSPEVVWLATTDADSRVPRDWLSTQLELAQQGAEAVLGTVVVRDWEGRGEWLRERFAAGYRQVEDHAHIHGANLGLTGSAYLAAGGVPPVAVAEDVGLVLALQGRRLVRTSRIPVSTSSRSDSRAHGGFGDFLNYLATEAPVPD